LLSIGQIQSISP